MYTVKATVTDQGVFRTHSNPVPVQTVDEAETLFGVRTITVDSIRGLQINGKTIKLRGGCVHHDNGLLVTDAQIPLKAVFSGVGELSGFGSANPVTEDNYTLPETHSFRGRATAVIRSGYEQGSAELVIENVQLGSFRTEIRMLL